MTVVEDLPASAHRDRPAQRRLVRLLGRKAGTGVRHDLEGLRAIAVLGVVLYPLRASWLPGGFAGVDVFFVLSGFFISGLLLREIDRTGTVDLRQFWGRRARRLLPASALVIVTTVTAGYLMVNALEAKRIAQDGVFSAVFAMNWRSAYQATDYLKDPNPSAFVHFWSLGVEEQFYLVWPLLLLALAAAWRWRRTLTPRRTLLVVALAVGVPSFLLALSQTDTSNSYAYFGTFERVWQLALGGVLAVLATRLTRLPRLLLVGSRYVGVALVVGFYLTASVDIVYPGYRALVPTAGAALIVAAGEPVWRRGDPLSWVLCSWPAQLGGRYSYSWYLWHYPPLVLFPVYLYRPLRIRELGYCAVGTFALAVLTYHLLENPVRSSRWLAVRHGGRSLALGALLVVAGLGASQWAVTASTSAAKATVRTTTGATLSPTPAAAGAEEPQPARDGCQVAYTSSALSRECRYLPDTGHGDVVLVGDSHGAMWYPAVHALAERHRWGMRVWARTSCPFADVVKDGPNGGRYTQCDRWHADILRRLVAAHPSLVIVSSFDSRLNPIYDRATGKRLSQAAARQAFQDGMAKYLRVLRAAGIHVLVIGDVPGYATSAPDCVLANSGDLGRCSAPQREALPGAPDDLQAARSVPGVHAVDFTSTFCRAGTCHQVVGSTLAYRDPNHLTLEMIMRLEPALDRAAVRAAA